MRQDARCDVIDDLTSKIKAEILGGGSEKANCGGVRGARSIWLDRGDTERSHHGAGPARRESGPFCDVRPSRDRKPISKHYSRYVRAWRTAQRPFRTRASRS